MKFKWLIVLPVLATALCWGINEEVSARRLSMSSAKEKPATASQDAEERRKQLERLEAHLSDATPNRPEEERVRRFFSEGIAKLGLQIPFEVHCGRRVCKSVLIMPVEQMELLRQLQPPKDTEYLYVAEQGVESELIIYSTTAGIRLDELLASGKAG